MTVENSTSNDIGEEVVRGAAGMPEPSPPAADSVVDDIKINWVWMPPWGPDKITEDGREQLRALGFNV